MVRFLNTLLWGVFCAMVVCCAGPSDGGSSGGPVSFSVDSLRSGDLVCRLGDGYFSGLFRRYSGGEERFSHIGIVHWEDSVCCVIHADANELTGEGSVRIDALSEFLDHALDYQFYPVTADSLRRRIDSVAYDYALRHTPFDLSFDLTSDSTLYCSELVALSINKALNDSSFVPTYPLRKDFSYYRIADILGCGVVE